MEPFEELIAERDHPGQRQPGGGKFGKAGVKAGGELQSAPQAPAPGRKTDQALGRDIDRIRSEGLDGAPDIAGRRDGKADLRIERQRDRRVPLGGEKQQLMIESP